jgi:predicted nucleotidyltransferase component of viral defense system
MDRTKGLPIPDAHESQGRFRAAIQYTAAQRGFATGLIEKDYFCSLVLSSLSHHVGTGLIFKGGTCLTKVHAGFYRLSEDLDFSIPMPEGATRAQRREAIGPAKAWFEVLPREIPAFTVVRNLSGSNESRQYNGELRYTSAVTGQKGGIKVEVGLREEIQESPFRGSLRTLLLNPHTTKDFVPPFPCDCLSLREAYAEKMRAALTRREPAIRDLFDLSCALERKTIELSDPAFLAILRKKLSIKGTDPVALSADRIQSLRRQVETELRHVLRAEDFDTFDLTAIVRKLETFVRENSLG